MHTTRSRPKVVVSADGYGVVSHAGFRLQADLADVTGSTSAYADALRQLRPRGTGHDPGRIAIDLAVMLADGGKAIAELAVLRDQTEVFGPSPPLRLPGVCWPTSTRRRAPSCARPGRPPQEVAWLQAAETGTPTAPEARRHSCITSVPCVTGASSPHSLSDTPSPNQFVGQSEPCPTMSGIPRWSRTAPCARGAEVAELTGAVDLDGYSGGTRILVWRERPRPGAQLSLFDLDEGMHHQVFLTDTPDGEGSLQHLDVRHRAHARVEDRIRGKTTGFGRLPSRHFPINAAWLELALTGVDLLAWTQTPLLKVEVGHR